jgi:hypothetical protein
MKATLLQTWQEAMDASHSPYEAGYVGYGVV